MQPESTSPAQPMEASLRRSEASDAPPDRIYLSPPHMSQYEWPLLQDAFESNWIAPIGPHVVGFENEFAELSHRRHAVAMSSCTAALHLAQKVLGVSAGDEVLTSTMTFVATANSICYLGAKPVFIDSDEHTWNMDPQLLSEELERRAKTNRLPAAVMAVDVIGQCADYDAITQLCDFYQVPLIEDAAESLGAQYRGKPAGSFGKIACFSFNGNKIITTSGGGMMVTDDRDLAQRILSLSTQARLPEPHYEHAEVGYNYRMSNLLAAVGRGQLKVLAERVNQRRNVFTTYKESLQDIPGIRYMPEPEGYRSTRWLTAITIDPAKFGTDREVLRLAMEANNIEARPLWKPMHCQPVFADCQSVGGRVSEQVFQDGLCLPSGSSMTSDQINRVVAVVRQVHSKARASAQGTSVTPTGSKED